MSEHAVPAKQIQVTSILSMVVNSEIQILFVISEIQGSDCEYECV